MADYRTGHVDRDTKRTWGIIASILALGLLGWGLYEAMDNDDGATGAEVDDTEMYEDRGVDTGATNNANTGADDGMSRASSDMDTSGAGYR